uniref:Uncharacterized protein n=1 Tax=Physcomitrium patens TaxID=3218 RepID=A0A2K1IME7_PHYPA|nr:hypothetical protein PHYPA_026764 [Physcomitrium patens]
MEDVPEESPDGYNVVVLLCTKMEELLQKVGGLIIKYEYSPEVARLMWRHRQA